MKSTQPVAIALSACQVAPRIDTNFSWGAVGSSRWRGVVQGRHQVDARPSY